MQWVAIYDEGAIGEQSGGYCDAPVSPHEGDHSWIQGCIDHQRVRFLEWQDEAGTVTRVRIPHDAEPLIIRRGGVVIDFEHATQYPEPTLHISGWRRGADALFVVIMPDGRIAVTDREEDFR